MPRFLRGVERVHRVVAHAPPLRILDEANDINALRRRVGRRLKVGRVEGLGAVVDRAEVESESAVPNAARAVRKTIGMSRVR